MMQEIFLLLVVVLGEHIRRPREVSSFSMVSNHQMETKDMAAFQVSPGMMEESVSGWGGHWRCCNLFFLLRGKEANLLRQILNAIILK